MTSLDLLPPQNPDPSAFLPDLGSRGSHTPEQRFLRADEVDALHPNSTMLLVCGQYNPHGEEGRVKKCWGL